MEATIPKICCGYWPRPATVLPTWCWARESPRRNPPARLRRKRIAGESKISGNLVGTLRAGWKILWVIAKYGLFFAR